MAGIVNSLGSNQNLYLFSRNKHFGEAKKEMDVNEMEAVKNSRSMIGKSFTRDKRG